METVLITGGSGLLGTRLTPMLEKKGYRVTHLSRRAGVKGNVKVYAWDVAKGTIDPEAIRTADHIIHLAGANIGEGRWTKKRREEILSSRVDAARLIYEQLRGSDKKLKSFITGSAVGYYGMVTSDRIYTEQDPPSNDFLGYICRMWEEAAGPIAAMKIRTVKLRFGVVLARDGGALKKMAGPVKNFIGSNLGSGKQYVPWIHLDDACRAVIFAMENEKMQGAYNIIAPAHATNADITKGIAKVLHKPLFLPPVPSFALKMILGDMYKMVVEGSRVSAEKLIDEGFEFEHPQLEGALRDLLK
jgi:uncharacterized protein (TIGR01777 family)